MKKLNQSGQVAPEFIFSIIITFGLFMLFMSITFTFTVVEVGQYVAFASARAQAGSNATPQAQLDAANKKYQSFASVPAFALLFKSNWFSFGKPDVRQGQGPSAGSGAGSASAMPLAAPGDFRQELGDQGNGSSLEFEQAYTGVSIPFESKVMGIQVPFLSPANTDNNAFVTHLNAILLREASVAECQSYWSPAVRGSALQKLPSGSFMKNTTNYYPMEDAGC